MSLSLKRSMIINSITDSLLSSSCFQQAGVIALRGPPEGAVEAHRGKDCLGLRQAAAVIVGVESAMIPALRQIPELRDRERCASFDLPDTAPVLQLLFRPEEQDRCSGLNQIIVPAPEGQQKMDHPRANCL